MTATAVVTAGGSGTRLAGSVPKQFLPIRGVPMIIHTLRAFERAKTIDEVVVTLPERELGRLSPEELDRYEIHKVSKVVAGGPSRQASVRLGLEVIASDPDYVAVHDAARCLVTPELIDATVRGCEGWDGAIAALPVGDTLKRVAADAIVETVPREGLWAMQTPQVFRFPLIRDAYRKADEGGAPATDDAQIAERFGARVRVVEGSARNFKVTYRDDLALAEAWLEER